VTNETKLILVLLAIYLYFHWSGLRVALATGGTGSAGNPTAGSNSLSGPAYAGAGSRGYDFRETWGSQY
jgi:hypothetical protein